MCYAFVLFQSELEEGRQQMELILTVNQNCLASEILAKLNCFYDSYVLLQPDVFEIVISMLQLSVVQ